MLVVHSQTTYYMQSFLLCTHVFCTGDGNFHVCIFFDPQSAHDVECARTLAQSMAMKAIAMEGTCTGEHGVGMGKKELLVHEAGTGAINLMRVIKTSIDPNNILNPGKVIDVIPPTPPLVGCAECSNSCTK